MAIIVPVRDLDSDETREVVVEGHSVAFEVDGTVLEPVYVSEAKTNLNANSETLTTDCGDTEVRRNGDTNWNFTCDGIITQDQLSTLQSIATSEDTVFVDAEILGSRSGPYVVKDCSITHSDELNTIDVPTDDGSASKPAYTFQITLKSPSGS